MKNQNAHVIGIFATTIFFSLSAWAADWQQTQFQYLHGNEYKNAAGSTYSQTVITLEHVSSWAYGNNFFFIDLAQPDTQEGSSFYAEFSPALSLTKTGVVMLSEGVVKDILIQSNFEWPQGPAQRAVLGGVTLEWQNLGVDYLATQFLYRDTHGVSGHTGQLTLVWTKNFGNDRLPLQFSGFIDWAGKEGSSADNFHTQPQLLFDFARSAKLKSPIKLGIEWQYWKNKYGIEGLEQSAPQIKFVWDL